MNAQHAETLPPLPERKFFDPMSGQPCYTAEQMREYARAAIAALSAAQGEERLAASLKQIAALDYKRAAINGCAYQAVQIATDALATRQPAQGGE